jgi:hypothetical protein
MPSDRFTDADVELAANAYHRTACRACSDPRDCPGVPECVYADHLDWDGFRAVLEALTAPGSPLVARIRAQAGEDIAEAIESTIIGGTALPPDLLPIRGARLPGSAYGSWAAQIARQVTTQVTEEENHADG